MLTLPELEFIGVPESKMKLIYSEVAENLEDIQRAFGDILVVADYDEIVDIIDDGLNGAESAHSASRIDEYNTAAVIDMVQATLVKTADVIRDGIKQSMQGNPEPLRDAVAKFSLSEFQRTKRNLHKQRKRVETIPQRVLEDEAYNFTYHLTSVLIQKLREDANGMQDTVRLAGLIKHDMPPESMLMTLLNRYLEENHDEFVFPLERLLTEYGS